MYKYAVLCGNSQFPNEADKSKLPDLTCPENDVDGLAKVLSSEQGGFFEVLSLKNKAHHQVQQELKRTLNKTQKNDLLLFYYSGHGKPNKSGKLYLTSFDTIIAELETTAISINYIYEILGTGNCKKIVIILDCCFSGAAGQGFKGDMDTQLQQLNNGRGTYLVTASTGMQVAHENEGDGFSLFTKHLIAGLETGDADIGGDGLVDMDELYEYVHSKVKTENPDQEPTQYITDKRGDLIIAKSGRDSRKERAERIRQLLLEFEKQDEAVAEIKSKAVFIARMPRPDLSEMQSKLDDLLSDLLSHKITLFTFIRHWDRLDAEIEKAQQENAAKEKTIRDLDALDKAQKEKATQVKKDPDKKPYKALAIWTAAIILIATSVIYVISNIGQQPRAAQDTLIANEQRATEQEKLQLGSTGPGGGKVFYVDNTGKHGLEAKAKDEPKPMDWDAANKAAKGHGSGWHLPSKDELNLLYTQKDVVGGFASNNYWSSTEIDSDFAWFQSFGNGDQDYYNKNYTFAVRAVRAF